MSERFKNRSPGGTYRDLVEALDWSAGEILATLERLGLDGVISFGQDMTGCLAGSQIGGTWTVDWYEIPDDRILRLREGAVHRHQAGPSGRRPHFFRAYLNTAGAGLPELVQASSW